MHRVPSLMRAWKWPLAVGLAASLLGLASAGAAAEQPTTPVVPPLAITTSVLPTAQAGSAFTDTLATAGGSGPVTWSVLAGSTLPAGLTLSPSTGVLSGTPTATGTTQFAVEATATGPVYSAPPGPPFEGLAPFPASQGFLQYVLTQLGLLPSGSGQKDQPATLDLNSAVTDLTLTVQSGVTVTTTELQSAQVHVPYFVTLTAQGGSGSGEFVWTPVAGTTLPPGLHLSPTGLLSGTPATVGSTTFSVQAADAATPQYPSAAQLLTLKVVPPGLQITTYALPDATAGVSYTAALSATGGIPAYQWSVVTGSGHLPTGLSLDAATGVISGTPTVAGTQGFTVQATDAGSKGGSIPPTSVTESLTITVHHGVGITIDTSEVPTLLTQNQNIDTVQGYTDTVTAGGGSGGFTYSLSGSPDGLIIGTATGTISGTPTQSGDFMLIVTATDSAGVSQSTQILVTVAQASALAIQTGSLPSGTVGVPYPTASKPGLTLVATGGITPYAWSATCSVNQSGGSAVGTCTADSAGNSLPAGLSLDPSTGKISGTPTAPGSYTIDVIVSDSGAAQSTCTPPTLGTSTPVTCATATLTLTIHSTALAITTTSPLPDAAVGEKYTQGGTAVQLQASGGVAPYTWQIEPCTTGQGPCFGFTGLTVQPNGDITGSPAAGSQGIYTFSVQVQDSLGNSANATLSLTVEPPLQITTAATLPEAPAGASYSQTLTASGGLTPYSWSLSCSAGSGSSCLPPGLSISGATISGTPVQGDGGTTPFTATVTDKGGASASQSMTITTLSVSTATLSGGSTTAAYSATLSAVGGSGGYSWSCSGLPAGLSCSPTGTLSGTATATGTFNVQLTVTDSSGVSSTRTVSLTIT